MSNLRFVILLACLTLATPGTLAAVPAKARTVTSAALPLPLVWQTYNACGPASLSMLLAYWGHQQTQAEISPLVRPSPTSYMPVKTIAPFAAQYQLQTRVVSKASVNTVRALTANGIPVLLLTDLETPGKLPHWRVASGFDDTRRSLIFHDPLKGYISITYDDVNLLWSGHSNLMVVLFPEAQRDVVLRSLSIT